MPIYARSLKLIVGHGDLRQAELVHFNTILVGGNGGCTRLPEVVAFCEINNMKYIFSTTHLLGTDGALMASSR